ncbi:hypothetical protein [Clostridium sp. M14]|uniref:hypothetical protein n=1 Tax=Clostridium sp. M14 TaxID=2716311 RepID=UPI0013EE6026|nr:hypothetical protein [Clostridium sp. M14]MBZ9693442.1 hypothetical protein [Clostridium sp. M14]
MLLKLKSNRVFIKRIEKIVSKLNGCGFKTEKEQRQDQINARQKQCNFIDAQLYTMQERPELYKGKDFDVIFQIPFEDCKMYAVSKSDILTLDIPHSRLLRLSIKIPKDSDIGKKLSNYGITSDNSIKASNELHVVGKIKNIEYNHIELEENSLKYEIIY